MKKEVAAVGPTTSMDRTAPVTPEQFLQIAGPLPESALLLAGNGLILSSNQATEERLGLPLQNIRGRLLAELVVEPPGDIMQYLQACSRSRKMVLGSVTLLGQDGKPIPCRAEGAVIRAADEATAGLLLLRLVPKDSVTGQFIALSQRIEELGKEIQRRKQAEDALRDSEERFRTLADNMSQFAWMADEKGWIFWYNRRWYEYTGTALGEMQGWGWKKVHHPDHVKRVVARIQRSWDTGEAWEDTFPLRGKDGGYRWFLSRALPIRDAQGRVIRWFGTNTDVTEERLAEEKLRNLTQDLEKRVADRTQELRQANLALLRDMDERKRLEEQLLQAQKMESVGTLAGGIAHDFNNILNIMQGYTYLLRAQNNVQNEEIGEILNVITETIQRGSTLVQQLLTLARKTGAKLESADINRLIQGLITLISQMFPKTVELKSDLRAGLAPILADANQITQALLNLSLNARDAMLEGGRLMFKTLSVDGASLPAMIDAPQERYVCIEVADTGVGMQEDVQKRIFEPFRWSMES